MKNEFKNFFKRHYVAVIETKKSVICEEVYYYNEPSICEFKYNPLGFEEADGHYTKITPIHIYIIAEDDIKIGDWYINDFNHSIKVFKCNEEELYDGDNVKIIASSDPNFTELPFIPIDFIRQFCSEPDGLNEVDVEMELEAYFENNSTYKVKINKDNTITTKVPKVNWTKEELLELCESYHQVRISDSEETTIDEWVNRNL